MPKQYTLDEAKAKYAAAGKEWTPEVEAAAIAKGYIKAPPAEEAADSPATDLPWWQDLGLGAAQMAAPLEMRGVFERMEKAATGTSASEQMTQGAVRGLTAGNFSLPGVPEAQTGAQKAFQAGGAGVGIVGAMNPISRAVGPVTRGIVNPLLRTAATGSLGFGAYEAAAPAESGAQRLLHALRGSAIGAGAALVPGLPGVRNVTAIPHVGRPLVDTAQFTALGIAEGQSPQDALLSAAPMVAASSALHGAAGSKADKFQEKVQARAKELLEADLAVKAAEKSKGAAELEAVLTRNRAETAASRARHDEMLAADRQRGLQKAEQPNSDQIRRAEMARVNIQQASGQARRAAEQAQYNKFTEEFRQGIEAKRQQNLEAEAQQHAERMARIAEVRAQTGANRRANGRDVDLNSFGVPNESIELLRNGLKRLRETGRAIEGRQVERQAEALANRARRGRPAGGLERLAPEYANRDGDGQMKPIENIALSYVLADYGNGKITADQLRAEIKNRPELMKLPEDVRKQLGLPFERGGELNEGTAFEPVSLKAVLPGKVGDVVNSLAGRKLSRATPEYMDRRRTARRIGGGDFNNPIYKTSVRLGEQIEVVRDKLNADLQESIIRSVEQAGFTESTPDLKIVAQLLDGVYRPGWTLDSVTRSAAGQALLAKAERPDATLAAVKGVADQLVRQGEFRDAIRAAIGLRPMPKNESYWPHTERTYKMQGEMLQRLEQIVRERTESLPQPMNALDKMATPLEKRLYSSREMSRAKESTLRADQINYELMDVLTKYTLDTTRMFTNTMALAHGMNISEAIHARADMIMAKGGPEAYSQAEILRGAADAMAAITHFAYGNKLGPVSGGVQELLGSMPGGRVVLSNDMAIKNAFNAARYALNFRFMLFTQWTSLGAAAAHGTLTPAEIASALKESASPRIRDEWHDSYTRFAKNRKYGTVGNESNLRVDRMASPIDKWKRGKYKAVADRASALADAPTNHVENATGRIAFAFAEKMAQKAGLSPEDARAWKSDFAGLTQSFFDRTNRAGILSTPILNTAFPAQGYAVDMANSLGDAFAGSYGPGKRQTSATKNAARAGALMASLYMFSMINTLLLTKETDPKKIALENLQSTAMSVTPYSSAWAYTGRGRRGGQTYHSRLMVEQVESAKKIADGDIEGGMVGVANAFVKGGGLVKRIADTNQKIAEGVLKPSERVEGYFVGWDNTASGKEYMRKRLGIDKGKKTGSGVGVAPAR